jgi:hypothetical protein
MLGQGPLYHYVVDPFAHSVDVCARGHAGKVDRQFRNLLGFFFPVSALSVYND